MQLDRLIARPTTRPRLVALERALGRAIRARYGARLWKDTPPAVRATMALLIARDARRANRRLVARMMRQVMPVAKAFSAAMSKAEAAIATDPRLTAELAARLRADADRGRLQGHG